MKKRLLWIAELFIWFLILVLISGGIMLIKYNFKKSFNTYQMFLPDVDGLVNGSPVKMMGINIGYVSQLDIVGEDVYVKFVVTTQDVKIPYGSIATVEFSGLGGSKSLEIYPPQTNSVHFKKLINPQSPKRIHDSLGLLNDMIEKLISLTYDVSHFMDRLGIIKHSSGNSGSEAIKAPIKALEASNGWLDKMQGCCEKFYNKINNKKDIEHEPK